MKPLVPLLSLVLSMSAVIGETPQSPNATEPILQSPPPGKRHWGDDKMRERFMGNLSPEMRARFHTAREKALKDPALQALRATAQKANEEFRRAMRDAMMKADPGLADVLKDAMKERGKESKKKKGDFGALNEGDRQRLMAAREKAKLDPAVVAADAKLKAATTSPERETAKGERRQAMGKAILAADPTLAPLLDKARPQNP